MPHSQESQPIKVISFNLRHDSLFARKNRWESRRELAAQLIQNSDAVIIGVQEMTPAMREDLERLLEGHYTVTGFGRNYGSRKGQGEHSDILINTRLADLKYCKTFWLSKEPERYGSKAYYAFFPRICTVAEVRLKATHQRIRVFNTHFDHVCGMARDLGVHIILSYMEGFNREDPLPTILMGDMNAWYRSRPIRTLRENRHDFPHVHLTDVYSVFDPQSITNTFHRFSGKAKAGKSPVDYIFVSDEFDILESHIYTLPVEGQYPSDHYPLVATLRLKNTVPDPYSKSNPPTVDWNTPDLGKSS